MADFNIGAEHLSEQAKKQILRYIEQMEKGTVKLPREEQLAIIIGVSRTTIRKALNDLASEGIVFREQGKGTFVNVDSLNIKVKFNPAMEFTQMIRKSGYCPSVKILDVQMVAWDEKIGTMLQLAESKHLVRTSKIFMADDKFCAYCVDYFSPELIGGEAGLAHFTKFEFSIFDYIYNTSKEKVKWDKVEIGAVSGSEIQGLKKHIPIKDYGKKAYLCVKGVDYSMDNQPLLYAEEYIDTEFIKFHMIRQRLVHYTEE